MMSTRLPVPRGSHPAARLILGLILLLTHITRAEADQLVQTFTVEEAFGVGHPMQLLEFSITNAVDWTNAYITGPEDSEVAYQVLSNGKVAVLGALPANGTNSWQLLTGRAPDPPSTDLHLFETATYYEITNEWIGVRLTKPTTNLAFPPAPIQGIKQHNGTWTAVGPNYLSLPDPNRCYGEVPSAVTNMSVELVEVGPLCIVVEVSYQLHRAAACYASEELAPTGAGFYVSTIRIEAGQPSLLVEEDMDTEVSYTLDVSPGLDPNQARYRGHTSYSVLYGYDPTGQQYRPGGSGPAMDAFVDLHFDDPVTISYNASPTTRRPMSIWDPWAANTGWYWQLFDSNAPPGANLLGIFAGSASRVVGSADAGIGVLTEPAGVTDMVSVLGTNQELHVVYQSSGDLWYLRLDNTLTPGVPTSIASGLQYPNLLVRDDGHISVVAYHPVEGVFHQIEKGTNSAFFTNSILAFDQPQLVTVHAPYAYQQSYGTNDFLVIFGEYDTESGALLFYRPQTTEAYVYSGSLAAFDVEALRRPVFTKSSDGSVLLYYTDPGTLLSLATIQPGAVAFGSPNDGRVSPNIVNFGAGADTGGDVIVGDHTGTLFYKFTTNDWVSTNVSLTVNATTKPSIALASDGTALLAHGAIWPYSHMRFYRMLKGKWELFSAAEELQISSAQAHYHEATDQFVVLGRTAGQLTVYGWTTNQTNFQLLAQLPATRRDRTAFQLYAHRRAPDSRFFPHIRFSWGLFAGSKGQDLVDPYEIQPIGRQMNLHAGINLNKVKDYLLDYPDPPQGYGGLFMDPAILQEMIARLRADTTGPYGGGYYSYLYGAEPSARELIDMWADTNGVKRAEAVADIFSLGQDILDVMVNGGGIYDLNYHYWHGGLEMQRRGLFIDSVLADDLASADERAKVKAAASLFAHILWDDDFVPLNYEENGLNMGQQNMVAQQLSYRDFFALLLAGHPHMAARSAEVEQRALSGVNSILSDAGETIAAGNYIGPLMAPLLNNLLQLRMLGGTDPFAVEPKLSAFAEFYMNFLTPPEVRFGGHRKVVAFGDSATQAPETLERMATGFRTADPELSAQLMGLWNESGKPHSGFFGTTLLMVDESAPAKAVKLGDANFPDFYSVLRDGGGTTNETALWFLNGSRFTEHRHNDYGSVVLYALGAPLIVDWGSFYYPHTPGSYMHSMAVPEDVIGQAWNQDNAPLDSAAGWLVSSSTQEAFESFDKSAHARARFTTDNGLVWRRSVYVLRPDEDYPMIYLADSFSGTNANTNKVLSLNLMAEGPVETPIGVVTPTNRLDTSSESGGHSEFPSSGTVLPLISGVNHFGFQGQWLIDWDLYTVSDSAQEAFIGNWGHTWNHSREESEFALANGRPFDEKQHFLRVRSSGDFGTLILPHRKGAERPDLQVSQVGQTLLISTSNEWSQVAPHFFSYTNLSRRVLASFDAQQAAAHGLSITGGPAELVIESEIATITAHGNAGLRRLQFPGAWTVTSPITLNSNEYWLDYDGGFPLRVTMYQQPPEEIPQGADSFDSASVLSGMTLSNSVSTSSATKESGEPNHAGFAGGRSVWWLWTAPYPGLATVETVDSSFDTLLAVYTGSQLSNLVLVAENDDATNGVPNSRVDFIASEGETYRIAVDGFDGAFGTATLTVDLKVFPELPVQNNRTVLEWEPLLVTNGVTNLALLSEAANYTLIEAPGGAAISSLGLITWTPTETQGPGVHSFVTVVAAGDSPLFQDTNAFLVTVTEVNEAPVFDSAPGDVEVVELTPLSVINGATDADVPQQHLTYSLMAAPTNAVIDTNGVVTWLPTEMQGPGTNIFITFVSDGLVGTSNAFQAIVLESNSPPSLASFADQTLHAGEILVISNLATDSDYPPNLLSLALAPGSPPDSIITNDTLIWATDIESENTTNTFTLTVTDNGDPSLGDMTSFGVIVVSPIVVEGITRDLLTGTVESSWTAIPGRQYRLQQQEPLGSADWTDATGDIQAIGTTASAVVPIAQTDWRFYRVRLLP